MSTTTNAPDLPSPTSPPTRDQRRIRRGRPTKEGARTLMQRLCDARADMKAIVSDGVNQDKEYSYATAKALFERARPALAKHGVGFAYTLELESMTHDRCETKNGFPYMRVTLPITYLLESVEDPDDWIEIDMAQLANDFDGDKGINKCLTNALKYFLFTLLIVTGGGDDMEADQTPDTHGQAQGATNGRNGNGGNGHAGGNGHSAPKTQGAVLGIPFIAEVRGRLRTINKDLSALKLAIEQSGEGDKCTAQDPAQWDASLREGIEKWISMHEGKAGGARVGTPVLNGHHGNNGHAKAPDPSVSATAKLVSMANPNRKAWPVPARKTPAHVCYWIQQLTIKARHAIEAAETDPLKSAAPEQLVAALEVAMDLPDANSGVEEVEAAGAYRMAMHRLDNREVTWNQVAEQAAGV